jgi:DNA-binding response OmpR family regulator
MSIAEQAGDKLETILVVEDEVIIRMNVSEYLRDCGYKVIEAASGDEALQVLKSPNIRVDIVFSDVQMPGTLDGFGLSQWIRAHRPEVRVLLAGTLDRAVHTAAEVCEDGPLTKPYEPRTLLRRIKQLQRSKADPAAR